MLAISLLYISFITLRYTPPPIVSSGLLSWEDVGLWRWWSDFHIKDCWCIYCYEYVESSLHPLYPCPAERYWLLLLGPCVVWVAAMLAVWTGHGCVLPFPLSCCPWKSFDVASRLVELGSESPWDFTFKLFLVGKLCLTKLVTLLGMNSVKF